MRHLVISFIAALALSVLPVNAWAARRALIIGNNNYPTSPLKNATNDAVAMAAALRSLGYSTVVQYDANRQHMDQAFTLFLSGIGAGDIVVFYYSGHGLQVDGENYLIPTDFTLGSPADLKYRAFSLSEMIDKFSGRGAITNIIILDACRNNPFTSVRSLRGGWASMGTSAGTFLAFATAPGSTASDNGSDEHGLFTKGLLQYISSPLDIEEMFEKVREEVILQSNGLQVPWTASSLIGSFHLNPALDASSLANLEFVHPVNGVESTQANAGARSGGLSKAPYNNQTTSARILVNEALLLAQQDDYDRALHSLSAALSADPTFSIAFRLIGLIFHLLGRSADSLKAFDHALSADPTDYLAYYYRCLALAATDPASAVRDCEASVGIRPDFAGAHLGMSNALLALGETNKAYSEADQAIRLDPRSPLGYALRGRAAAGRGRYSEAISSYENAIRLTRLNQPH